jgi:cobalt-zinc-cadmium efflux system membrane fusion protein
MIQRTLTHLFTCTLVAGFCIAAGCSRNPAPSQEGKNAEKEQELPVGALTVEQVLAARCPHGPTIECAECRYEVGVVKLDPALLKVADNAATGLVRTVSVARRAMTTAIEVAGEIRLNENAAVHVSPRIPGIIRAVNVDIGAEVAAEAVLFSVDSVELAQVVSDYEKNAALAELSGRTYRREKALYEQKIGAESDMIEAQMRFEENQTARRASEKRLHVLGVPAAEIAALTNGQHDAAGGSLAVRTPIKGTVIEKHAVVGEQTEPGKDVMVVADLDTVWMWAGIYERDLRLLPARPSADGVPVDIAVPAFPNAVFRGRMDYVGSVVDETTRTVPVRTIVDNRDRRLRPGMFCQGRILLKAGEEVLAVPRTALLSDEGTSFVFRHMKDDYYLRVNVAKGREFADGVEICGGLSAGDTVVADGAFILKSDVLRSKMGAGCAD